MTETYEGLRALFSPIIVMVLGMVVLLLDVGRPDPSRRRMLPTLSIVGLILAAAAGAAMLAQPTLDADVEAMAFFGRGMVADSFGGLFCIVLCIIAALAIMMSPRYLDERGMSHGEFYALILFSTSGAMLMALSYDLVNVFLGLEVLSIALYILSGYARRDLRSEESAVKYFLLGSFASGFLLYGTALVYGAVGLSIRQSGATLFSGYSYTNLHVIAQMLSQTADSTTPLLTSPVFVAGMLLLIVGLGFKAAIVPFHLYAPDVYEGAPTPVTAFMSAGAKAGAFAAFVRLIQVLPTSAEASDVYRAVLWGLAAATMIVGNVLAVRQSNIKRMLAYSSIAHAGYILVGILAASRMEAVELARGSVLYYMFAYTFMNLGAFAVVVWLSRGGREYLQISDYAGLSRKNPLAAAVMAVFMLSLAGIPPAAGFFGKLYLFMAAVQADLVGLAALGVIVSVIGVFYYLNIIVTMYFRSPEHEFESGRHGGARWASILSAVATLVLGVVPTGIFNPDMSGSTPRRPPAPQQSSGARPSGPAGMPPVTAPTGSAPGPNASQ